ncbi:MAG: hypothetical protein GEV11_26895 [Streptosporangiales bacterium]|nr:hypothetical protein [Streptosporangiales bacterium]
MKRHTLIVAVLAVAAAIAAGVSVTLVVAPDAPAARPAAATASATPAREQAARQFLLIVKPGEDMRARCVRAETMFEEEKSPAAFDEVKDCLRAYAAVSHSVAGGLRSAAWPAEAARDVERLAAVSSARASALQRASRVRTFD